MKRVADVRHRSSIARLEVVLVLLAVVVMSAVLAPALASAECQSPGRRGSRLHLAGGAVGLVIHAAMSSITGRATWPSF